MHKPNLFRFPVLALAIASLLAVSAGVRAQYTPGIANDARGPYTNTYIAPWYYPAYDLTFNPMGPSELRPIPSLMTSINYPGINGAFVTGPVVASYPSLRVYGETSTMRATQFETFPRGSISNRPAYIDVRLPATAELWFQGVKTEAQGSSRQFVSPPLNPDRSYGYDVRATWYENGRVVTDERHVRLSGGTTISVDFTRPGTIQRSPTSEGSPSELRTRPIR